MKVEWNSPKPMALLAEKEIFHIKLNFFSSPYFQNKRPSIRKNENNCKVFVFLIFLWVFIPLRFLTDGIHVYISDMFVFKLPGSYYLCEYRLC